MIEFLKKYVLYGKSITIAPSYIAIYIYSQGSQEYGNMIIGKNNKVKLFGQLLNKDFKLHFALENDKSKYKMKYNYSEILYFIYQNHKDIIYFPVKETKIEILNIIRMEKLKILYETIA